MDIPYIYAAKSDTGQVRQKNEDSWFANPGKGLFILSDGMGGKRGGDVASKIVAEALPSILPDLDAVTDLAEERARHIVADAVEKLNREVLAAGKKKAALGGMGATLAMVAIHGDKALIVYAGDSRAYLFRDESLTLLTKDHSIVQILVDSGQITPEEVATHPARSQLTRYIGMEGEVRPESVVIDLEPGDRLLLCSDGLTGMVQDEKMAVELGESVEPKVVCQRLVDLANANGGRDNITVLIIDWFGDDQAFGDMPTMEMTPPQGA